MDDDEWANGVVQNQTCHMPRQEMPTSSQRKIVEGYIIDHMENNKELYTFLEILIMQNKIYVEHNTKLYWKF